MPVTPIPRPTSPPGSAADAAPPHGSWRQQYRSELDLSTLLPAWQRRGWIIPAAGSASGRPTYHPRIRTLA